VNALATLIADRIRDTGPIGLDDFMAAATRHYYASRDPFGARGDFITAPEISQMFGELIGAWCADTWRQMGAPKRFVLAELGPGRGTLLSDALRAVPELAVAELHLVEGSPALRAMQAEKLARYAPRWHERVEDLPGGPMILIANEFLDALPIRQFERAAAGWRERRVGLGGSGFAFTLAPTTESLPEAPLGAIREICPAARELAAWLAARLQRDGGAALFVDYGYVAGGFGDTLQSLRAHRRHDVLDDPGEADITGHVDFTAFARAATGANIFGPVEQGAFLHRLGIAERAERLMRSASREQARQIASARRRLVDPGAMGSLFKVMALANPALPTPAGFEG